MSPWKGTIVEGKSSSNHEFWGSLRWYVSLPEGEYSNASIFHCHVGSKDISKPSPTSRFDVNFNQVVIFLHDSKNIEKIKEQQRDHLKKNIIRIKMCIFIEKYYIHIYIYLCVLVMHLCPHGLKHKSWESQPITKAWEHPWTNSIPPDRANGSNSRPFYIQKAGICLEVSVKKRPGWW